MPPKKNASSVTPKDAQPATAATGSKKRGRAPGEKKGRRGPVEEKRLAPSELKFTAKMSKTAYMMFPWETYLQRHHIQLDLFGKWIKLLFYQFVLLQHNIYRPKEVKEEAKGIVLYLHLQGSEASPSRYWSVLESHEYHELLCE